MDFKKHGAKIHKITNETLFRSLKLGEYKKLIKLIDELFDAAQKETNHQ